MGMLQLRPARQMLAGLIPLTVIVVILIVVLATRLSTVSGPLRSATATATGTVTSTGLGAAGLQVAVAYTDAAGSPQTGRLTLDVPRDIPLQTSIRIAYDPQRPAAVFAAGDGVTTAVNNIVNGMLILVLVLVGAVVTTAVRLLRRARLAQRPTAQVLLRRTKYRRGLAERSWLVLNTVRGSVYVPVYWDPALERFGEAQAAALVHGSPVEDALLAFEVQGQTVWPSGRRRLDPPRGVERDVAPQPGRPVSLLRQVRTDVIPVFFAPVLGLLWAYIDQSGPAGFAFASLAAAGVLFWLPTVYGSDPS